MGKRAKKRKAKDTDQFGSYSDDEIVQIVTMLAEYPSLLCVKLATGQPISEATEEAIYRELVRRNLIARAAAYAEELGARDAYAALLAYAPIEGVQT